MTLIEVLVTGVLFSVVLTMIAQAMVTGHRSQRSLSHKIDIYRKASTALDFLIRDVESAQLRAALSYISGGAPNPVPTTTTVVDGPNELRIARSEGGATIYDTPAQIFVGYRRDSTDSTLRRTVYDSVANPLPGTPALGRVIAKDVKAFDVKLTEDTSTSLWALTVRLQIGTIGEPLTKEIWVEP